MKLCETHRTFTELVFDSNKKIKPLLQRYRPLADRAQKTSLVCLWDALRWAHRAPKKNTSSQSRRPIMWWRQVRSEAYLQHVTQHVHSLEYSQPKLWDAFWFFLWFGFFFLCVLNGSFFLYFLLKWRQQNTNRGSRLGVSNAHNNARRLVPPGVSCSSSGSSRITVASVSIHDPLFQVVTSERWRKTSTGTYSERVLLFPVASPLALLICGFYRPRHDVSSLQRTQKTAGEFPQH